MHLAKKLLNYFKNPPGKYRSIPFWSWNDHLEITELLRQIDLMHESGIGGFFMHSRDGLETPYLEKEWDECVVACVKRAEELGMEAWLYDEDRWPSGFCGGRVQKQVGSLKGLTMEVLTDVPEIILEGSIIALYSARIKGYQIDSFKRLPVNNAVSIPDGETLLVVRIEESDPSVWFNGYPPPDNLNAKSVETFINLTHEHYSDLLGKSFSETVKGSFSDEASLCDRHASFNPNRGWIPWTTELESWMNEHLGYDFLDFIPYFYFTGELTTKIRFDYWHMIALRFEECYSGQIGKWCTDHGIAYTGHFLQEDKLGLCCRVNGYIMPHYTHQGVLGIDMLCEQTDEYMTVKQCTSVAHQFNKVDVLTETYAATGWEFTFEGQKWIGDWQYVLGVNRICQHLALYSIRGCRKRDYPPCFNYNTSWWSQVKVIEDYFARLSVILHSGKTVCNVLILHPMSHVWTNLGCSPYGNPVRNEEPGIKVMDEYGYRFNNLLKKICELHIDYDLGDETIIQRSGSVRDGKVIIGDSEYSTLIIPGMSCIFSSTYSLLKEYKQQGGNIVIMSPLPDMIEGINIAELTAFFSGCTVLSSEEELLKYLDTEYPKTISIKEYNNIECSSALARVLEDRDKLYVFIVNNDRNTGHHITIKTAFSGKITKMDPLDGTLEPLSALASDSAGMSWKVSIEPCDSLLYMVDTNEKPIIKSEQKESLKELFRFPDIWEGKIDLPNALTLDMCKWSFDQIKFSDSMEVWKAQKKIREELEMSPIDTDEIIQRYQWINTSVKNDGTKIILQFSFVTAEDILEPVSLVVENCKYFKISLDGSPIENKSYGYYLDRSFDIVSMGVILKGTHNILLETEYWNRTELEAIYVIGNFSVNSHRELVKLSREYHTGDWTSQGLLHYPGSLTYCNSFELTDIKNNLILDVGIFSATCIQVRINGVRYDIPWKAKRKIDITSACRKGSNTIEIQLFGSPRNLLGPFHLKGKKRLFCNSGCFMPADADYDPDYHIVAYGLMESVILYERQ